MADAPPSMVRSSQLFEQDRNVTIWQSAETAMTSTGTVIAIVDDDVAVCDSMRFLLETYNFDVHTYQSGADFLHDNSVIDCLIVDYHMPGLNGLELVTELRKRGHAVPVIIMITAATDPSVERSAAELGIRHILKKPLANQVLLSTLRDQLGQ
jgi:two-component system, LuxR family, response regulator FixJ